MVKRCCLLFYAFLFLAIEQGLSQETYKAAVVEYYPIQNSTLTPEERTNANVEEYIKLISELEEKNFDILVYPEDTITNGALPTRQNLLALATFVPEASEGITPCDVEEYPEFFRKLSCFAKVLSSYLVVNLIEKEECVSDCEPDEWYLYNSDVVFNRSGAVVQKYRKYNLFGEYEMKQTDEAEVAIFDTDFGVKFGLFTCFDILFEKPALQLVRQGVKHIVFPTMWFSELPFLTALQAQTMFAVENDVVVLASGANSARRGSGGSGIFQGKFGALVQDIISNDGSKVYVRDVLKEWDKVDVPDNQNETNQNDTDAWALAMDNFYLQKENLTQFHISPVVDKEFDDTFEADDITCRVSWKINYENVSGEYYEYKFFYYSGVRSFSGIRDGGIDVCGFVFCQHSETDDYGSCGVRYPKYIDVKWPYTIEELTISSNFTVSDSSIQFPNTLLSSIRPMDKADYNWSSRYFDDGKIVERTLTLLKPQDRLLTFAVYGRDFSRDSSASWVFGNFAVVSGAVLIAILTF